MSYKRLLYLLLLVLVLVWNFSYPLGLNLEVFNNINFSSSQRLPETIAYISCNPTTLFSDINQIQKLSKFNYNIELINPFDMFPHTNHVETLVILKKMKPKVRQFEEKEKEIRA
jgi:hypothetical protein